MRFRYLLAAAMVAAFLGVTGIASAAKPGPALTCTGGTFTGDPSTSTFVSIPSGTYSSITIEGVCNVMPGAEINVTGDLTVAPGGLFDAQSAPATIMVKHDVMAGTGSFLGLGCLPDGAHAGHPCASDPSASSNIYIGGNVSETGASLVLLNGITVKKNVTLNGGVGNDWVFKWNTIGGNFTASNITPYFFLLGFNTVAKDVNLSNIWAVDPEDGGFGAVNLVINTIGHDLNCSGLGPRLSGGFIPGAVNNVGHKTIGQCVGLVGG